MDIQVKAQHLLQRLATLRPLFARLRRGPDLEAQVGIGMMTFFVLALPLILLMFSFSVNGMAFTAGYRRALALSTTAVQAGSAQVDFLGGSPSLNARACLEATQVVCNNVGGCPSSTVSASCGQTGNKLTVSVQIRPPLFLPAFWSGVGMRTAITATVTGGPAFGINASE